MKRTASSTPTLTPTLSVILALVSGSLATYFLDPQQGRRRRGLVRDKVYGTVVDVDDAVRVAAVDLRNRVKGTVATLRHRLTGKEEEVPDEVLVERVRAKLGRVVSHPGALEVTAIAGAVTLQGPVLERERERAVDAVASVPGVRAVIDRLEAHRQADGIPALQGGRPREDRLDIAQENWAPATRTLAGLGGGAMAWYGLSHRSLLAPALLLTGVTLLARAATNMDTRRLLGLRGHRGIDYTKTLHIAAPVDKVFALWQNFEDFPKFMRNVRRVHKNADGSWHWDVAGPLGARVQWDADVTQLVPNELIAWSTRPASAVQHAGMVRFQPWDGGTRIQIHLTYNPPAGALGHVVASLFGANPKMEMDEDLMRMKTMLETGKPPRDAAQPQVASRK